MTCTGNSSHVEQHLGDHLAALVDGELAHDARERVLAHLATCWTCKAEADAQRRLKSVFAETAPPPPSEGLLARLQELPGRDDDGSSHGGSAVKSQGNPFGSGGVFGVRQGEGFAYVPSGSHAVSKESGFPIHETERPSTGLRHGGPQRGRRFAFAAAGAVSLAALTLGGALPLEAAIDATGGRSDGAGATATPARTAQAGGAASVSGGDALQAVSGSDGSPILLSTPTGTATTHPPYALDPYTAPVLPTATGLSPLIRQVATARQATPFSFGEDVAGPTQAPAPTRLALFSSSPAER